MQFTVASLIFIGAAGVAASPVTGPADSGRFLRQRELFGYTEDGKADLKLDNRALFAYAQDDEVGHAIHQRNIAADGNDDDDDADDGIVLLRREERGNGTGIEYFGVDPAAAVLPTPTRTVERRGHDCVAKPEASCDTKKNQAQNLLCQSLISDLNAQWRTPVDKNWRRICYKGENQSCCTAWSNEISNMVQGDLTVEAEKIIENCSNDGISGKVYGTRIRNICTNQCVNAGHKCSG
ncbi:hypothetical protein PG993_003928 [Apiospora rasikravindrae]|uniref:WD-like domain-containing protein n=1 Tax=Apiospora rasikravindrae TaxID=990691 RepID=A0ABR1U0X5_9PEZI